MTQEQRSIWLGVGVAVGMGVLSAIVVAFIILWAMGWP